MLSEQITSLLNSKGLTGFQTSADKHGGVTVRPTDNNADPMAFIEAANQTLTAGLPAGRRVMVARSITDPNLYVR